jgi:hypothetical protein
MNLYKVTWLHIDGSIRTTTVGAINATKAGSNLFMNVEECNDILKVEEL